MANPWGGRRQWAQAVQQRRMQRLRPFQRPQPQVAPWRPAQALFPRNPLVEWWRNSVRQGVAWQRQWAEVGVAQLKAVEQALSTPTGSSPYRFAAGLPRFAGWGAGGAPWVQGFSPTAYSALDESTSDVSTTPVSETPEAPPPPSGTSEEGTEGERKPPNRAALEIFDDMDEQYHGKSPGFTEDGYPSMSKFNDELDDRHYGVKDGYARLSRSEVHALYDHHIHLVTLRKAEEEEEKEEGKKKPTQDDFLKAFKALKKDGLKLTKQGYPPDDPVDDYLHDHRFDVSSLNVDKVHRAFDKTGDFADDWREEEGKSKGGGGEHEKEEPEQDDFLKAFKAVKKAGHKLTKQGYPPDDEVDKYLDGRGFDVSSLNVDKVHRAFDKTGDFADDWREEEGKSKGGEHEAEKGKPKSDDFVACFKALKRENKKLTKDGYPHESDVEEYLRKQGFDVESLKTDRMHREFDKTGDFAEDWREEGR